MITMILYSEELDRPEYRTLDTAPFAFVHASAHLHSQCKVQSLHHKPLSVPIDR